MATITITRGLNEQGGDTDGNLISAFMQSSIEFEFDRGVLTGTYATVTIGTNAFFATKIATVGNIDTYVFDLTGILPYHLGFAPTSETVTGLTKDLIMVINGYNSAGVSQANATHSTMKLCFGYADIGTGGGLDTIYNAGGTTIYHNGSISFYNRYAAGTYTLTINGINYNYTILEGYNILNLHSSQLVNGIITSSGGLSIELIYNPSTLIDFITWINKSGAWSKYNFRYLNQIIDVKKSNEIPVYGIRNSDLYAKSVEISTEKKVSLSFDTIAIDDTHYVQLCEIAESPRVIYNNRVYKVKDSSKQIANCRQNLKFNITLEIEENAATY